jgi:hypothetical protein
MTDQYQICETAIMDRLKTLTSIFPKTWQVSDDDSVIQNGADYFAIFMPDSFPASRADGHDLFVNWVIIFDLYVRYSTRKESLPKFKAARSLIFNSLYPACINHVAGVSRAVLSANGGLYIDIAGDNPNFIIQTLSVTVTQKVIFNF